MHGTPCPTERATEHRRLRIVRDRRRIRIESGTCDYRHDDRVIELHRELRRSIRPGIRVVHLQLGGVRDADCRLLAVLVHAKQLARASRTRVIVSPSRSVRAWAELCRLSSLLGI